MAKQPAKIAELPAAKLGRTSDVLELSASLVTVSNPTGAAAESIRALRTHIQSQHLQEGRRALAVCGVSAGHGCTFIAANLALALAQIGISTLLIDANLREPGIDTLFPGSATGGGLRECLNNVNAPVAEFINEDVLPYLSILHAGGVAANPQELLSRERFEDVMNTCLRNYDATIIDTPPANSSADARRISNVAGYSLVVARKHKTLVSDLKVLVGQLEADRAIVVGTVLND
jgi:capsular exopolysaccharide synthesis family protein